MRVAILSDAPTLPTGFARTSRIIADALIDLGAEVVCFGIGIWGETFDRKNYKYSIWAVGGMGEDIRQKLPFFMAQTRPDVLIINYDLISTLTWLQTIREYNINCRVILNLVVDGLPLDPTFVRPLSNCEAIIVPVECVAKEIQRTLKTPVFTFPHLVDTEVFRPLPEIQELKRIWFPGTYIVGVIAQNRPRKQITQILQAVRLLLNQKIPVKVLLHTDRLNATHLGGSDLKRIIKYLALDEHVLSTEYRDLTDVSSESTPTVEVKITNQMNISVLRVMEKINLCDTMVVASACGGFEYNVIESQACGVIVCATKDSGIISEVAGNCTIPLEPALYDFTSYGAYYFRISPETIAEGLIQSFKKETQSLLVPQGLSNALRFDKISNLGKLNQLLRSLVWERVP